MSKRMVAVLTVLLAVGFVFAEWHEVAGGTGEVRVEILEQNASRTVFEVVVPGVEITTKEVDGEEFAVIELPGRRQATLEPGKPQVPLVPVLLARPYGAQVTVDVVAEQTTEIEVARPYPLQPRVTMSERQREFVIDREFYGRDGIYPPEDARLVHTATWRDLDVANIHVYPVRVNPGRRLVQVASRMRVTVEYSGGTYPTTTRGWMLPIYGRLVRNLAQLKLEPAADDPNACKYLAVVHENWWSGLPPIKWTRS